MEANEQEKRDILITTKSPLCPKPGYPVFVTRKGEPLGETEGLRRAMARLEWDDATLASKTGASPNTVRGWKVGRSMSVTALNVVREALEALEA